jgi:hypothetical protein
MSSLKRIATLPRCELLKGRAGAHLVLSARQATLCLVAIMLKILAGDGEAIQQLITYAARCSVQLLNVLFSVVTNGCIAQTASHIPY